MSEIYQNSMDDFFAYQKKLADTIAEYIPQMDINANMSKMVEYQEKVINGIKVMMNLKPEDVASDTLEKDVVYSDGKMRLLHYKPLVSSRKLSKVPTLITYALVNRQYMMDIQPDRSVLKSFLESGMDVYVIDWGYPTGEDMYLTLDDHINWYMDDCVEYIRKASGQPKINLLGICQGGTFSIIYSALHPEKIKNLVTMVVPVDFSTNDALLFRWSKDMNIDSLVDAYGVVPGDLMNFSYLLLKPISLIMDKYVGMAEKMDDPEFIVNFLRMEKWVFDSPDQAGETLRQFVKDLYQGNKLIKNELVVGGQQVDLKNITMPLLCACAEYDHLVPLSASKPLIDAVGSEDKEFLSFKTGHIGMYVSSKSQKEIAPKITDWFRDRS